MKPGDTIRVMGDQDKELVRRLVEVRGQLILICKEDEFQTARAEGREPVCVGFKVNKVVGVADDLVSS